MEGKPAGWGERYAAPFHDEDVAAAYRQRPPYPAETIAVLARLAGGGAVLDAGCGTAELGRRLAPHVARVDAVDPSAAMLAAARAEPGAGAPNLRLVQARLEEVELDPPYALVAAGESVHWLDWPRALPRIAALLDGGLLAVVGREWLCERRLRERLRPVYERHSWNRDFAPLDPVAELERRGRFLRLGDHRSRPVPWRPSLEQLVELHFSTSGFARSRLRDPERFAADLREALVDALAPRDGRCELDVVGTVVWGRPDTRPAAPPQPRPHGETEPGRGARPAAGAAAGTRNQGA